MLLPLRSALWLPEFFVVRAEYDRYAVDCRFGYVVYAYAETSSDVGNLSVLVDRR